MTELFRDTPFGHLLRFVSRGKILQYPDEANPSIYSQYLAKKSSDRSSSASGDEKPREQDPARPRLQNTLSRTESLSLYNELSRTHSARSQQRVGTGEQYGSAIETAASGAEGEKGDDPNLVTWYGDDDPENPRNWSLFKRTFVSFQICLLTTSVYIGSSIYSAGTESVMATFGVSQVAATLGLSLFVAGYGLGPMLWSPMSEIPQIGRNPVYMATLVVFVAFQAPTALASNFGMLLAFRFLTGFFGSPVLATGGASLTDIWRPSKQAYAIAIWGIAAVCGPTLGPLIGGFAVEFGPVPHHSGFTAHWTWPIWELMWLSAFCLVFLFFCFPETSANNILLRRTRRLRKATGNPDLKCQPEIMAEGMTGKDIAMMALVRPLTLNFLEPMVFLLNLYIALIYGLLYVWFESFVLVFIDVYHFGLGEEGLAYLGIFVGAIITLPALSWYIYHYVEPQFNENGEIQPEKRLPPAFVGAFCIPLCLFWFGFTAKASIHWIVPIIGSAWFSVGAFLLFNSVLNYLPDAYPDYAASVLAGNDLFRSSFGTGFPLFANAMYSKLGIDWATGLLGFLSIAFIPIPFVLYKFGPTLRKNYSRYARKDL